MAKGYEISFVVITPERQVLADRTTSLVFMAHDGELGVLHDRAPLMTELGIGQLRYAAGGQTRRMFIDGGFAQVLDNVVTVLTPHAVPAERITAEMVAEAERELAGLRTATEPEALEARLRATRRAAVMRELRVKS